MTSDRHSRCSPDTDCRLPSRGSARIDSDQSRTCHTSWLRDRIEAVVLVGDQVSDQKNTTHPIMSPIETMMIDPVIIILFDISAVSPPYSFSASA